MKIQKPVSLIMHEYLSGGRVDGFAGFEGLDDVTVTVVAGATVVVGATVLEVSLQDGSNRSRQTIIDNLCTSTLSHPFEQLCFMRQVCPAVEV